MMRLLFLVYGAVGYLLFLGVYAWLAAFVGNLLVPWSIDAPPGRLPFGLALAVDVGLLALFGLQHSIMARPAFKRVWTSIVPEPIERATYVVASCAALAALMLLWQPLGGIIWDAPAGVARWLLWAAFATGWLAVPGVSLMINHFDLFGVRQVWLHFMGRPYTSPDFHEPFAYAWVRHPLYIGWALAFWATPTMTLGHLLFAGVLTGYMIVASKIEERDLVHHYGEKYLDYRSRVPAFLPRLTRIGSRRDKRASSESTSSV
jgi:protein-S-isoprenylcysteine O-methyltransferase Ste14